MKLLEITCKYLKKIIDVAKAFSKGDYYLKYRYFMCVFYRGIMIGKFLNNFQTIQNDKYVLTIILRVTL